MPLWVLILICWNVLEIVLCGIDKLLAKQEKRRIPEKTLLGIALLGASQGLMVGMLLFHHKVSKPVFRFGAPAMALLHFALAGWLLQADIL